MDANAPSIEQFKRRGAFWRGLALVQAPISAFAIFLFLVNYILGDTIVSVPERKPPGEYQVDELPDREFINLSVGIVNALATFQPATARVQFEHARKFIGDALMQQFDSSQMQIELATAEQSGISQVFFMEPVLTSVKKDDEKNLAFVRISGVRNRFAQDRLLPPQEMSYRLTISPTKETSDENRYGLKVIHIEVTTAPLRVVAEEVRRENAEEAQRRDLKQKGRKKRKPLVGK